MLLFSIYRLFLNHTTRSCVFAGEWYATGQFMNPFPLPFRAILGREMPLRFGNAVRLDLFLHPTLPGFIANNRKKVKEYVGTEFTC